LEVSPKCTSERFSQFHYANLLSMKDRQTQLDRLLEQAAECAQIASQATDAARLAIAFVSALAATAANAQNAKSE
jgi:hypothetical protein